MAKTDIHAKEELEEADARIYEVGYQVLSTVPEERLPEETAKIKEAIVSAGGVILSEEEPKLMHLAYAMDKVIANKRSWFETAFFGWVKFEAAPEASKTIKKFLDENENILRFILIKTVRENTMAKKSILFAKKPLGEGTEGEGEKKVEPPQEINEVELDKQIEDLVVS